MLSIYCFPSIWCAFPKYFFRRFFLLLLLFMLEKNFVFVLIIVRLRRLQIFITHLTIYICKCGRMFSYFEFSEKMSVISRGFSFKVKHRVYKLYV